MHFALWPNLTQAFGPLWRSATQHDGARHLRAWRTHRLPTPAGPDPTPSLCHVPRRGDLAAPRRESLARHPERAGLPPARQRRGQAGTRARLRRRAGLHRARSAGPLTNGTLSRQLTADHVQVSIGAVSWSGGLCLGDPAVLVAGMEKDSRTHDSREAWSALRGLVPARPATPRAPKSAGRKVRVETTTFTKLETFFYLSRKDAEAV